MMENGKWKMNFMDFPEISGKKFILLFDWHFWSLFSDDVCSQWKISLTLSSSQLSTDNGLQKLQVKEIKISKFENLAASNTFFPTFTEENKILASFPSVKLEFRLC